MTSPRTPRQWNAGSEEPPADVTVLRYEHDLPFQFARRTGDAWTLEAHSDPAKWTSRERESWKVVSGYCAAWGPLSEVLPETPEPTQVGDRVIATQFGRAHETVEGVLEAPASPVDEPATVRRDDGIRIYILNVVKVVQARGHRGGCLGCEHDPAAYPPCWSEDEIDDDQSRRADWIRGTTRVPASQSVPAVPVSSTGGKETGEGDEDAQGADEPDYVTVPVTPQYVATRAIANIIDEHFGDDYEAAAWAAAEEIVRQGYAYPRLSSPLSREELGRRVSEVALKWSREQDDRPGATATWEQLADEFQELHMRVGEAMFGLGMTFSPAPSPLPDSETERGVWMSPDSVHLVVETDDGELDGLEHDSDAGWLLVGMYDQVPDEFIRLVPEVQS